MGEISTQGLLFPFKELNQKVLIIPGNHESAATTEFLAEKYDAVNLHGYSMRFEDVGIFGCGSANIGVFQLKDDEMFGLLKNGFDYVKDSKKRIMVTHVHPDKTLMSKFTENLFPGSKAVLKAIKEFKPDIAICSHVHEAEGIEEKIGNTRLINVGKTGKIIEI